MAVGDGQLALVVRGDGPAQVWLFDTVARRLQRREDLELGPVCALTPDGQVATLDAPSPQTAPPDTLLWARLGLGPRRVSIPPPALASSPATLPPFLRGPLTVSGSRLACQTCTITDSEVLVLDLDSGRGLASILLPGASHAAIRLSGRLLTIGDDRGRVLVLDLDRREVLRRLRT
jgi:hypothetical protein